MPDLKIYQDTTPQTRLSLEAQDFREAYQLTRSSSVKDRSRQRNLITEEFKEFLEAEALLYLSSKNVREDCLKELADLVYVCYQYAVNMQWDLDEALFRVHQSNMSKLDEYGKPIYREDGKVLKAPNYKPPNLEDLV